MGALTVTQIKARVTTQFGDTDGAQVVDASIINWVNDAMREITQQQDLLQKVGSSNSVANQAQYNLPTDVLHIRRLAYSGFALQQITIEDANNLVPGSSESVAQGYPVGTPISYWIYANQINLYPAPSVSIASGITIYYTRQPTVVTSTSDTPELPAEYDNRIVEYCLKQAFELDMNTTMMAIKQNEFQQGIDKMKGNPNWESQEAYPSVSVTREYPDDIIAAWYGS